MTEAMAIRIRRGLRLFSSSGDQPRARRATDSVVTAGATATDDAPLVLRRTGSPLVQPDRFHDLDGAPAAIFDGPEAQQRISELWQLLTTLHDSGLVHGQLDEEHLVVDDGQLGLVQFRAAAVAPTPAQLRSDDAQLFVGAL
jgi:hypothetical protein